MGNKEIWQNGHGHVEVEVLDRQVVETNGNIEIQKVFVKGHHPELGGELIQGLQGPETVILKRTRVYTPDWQIY